MGLNVGIYGIHGSPMECLGYRCPGDGGSPCLWDSCWSKQLNQVYKFCMIRPGCQNFKPHQAQRPGSRAVSVDVGPRTSVDVPCNRELLFKDMSGPVWIYTCRHSPAVSALESKTINNMISRVRVPGFSELPLLHEGTVVEVDLGQILGFSDHPHMACLHPLGVL